MSRGRYDLAVIGGGSAGLTAAIMAGRLGAKVALVDKERLGGDCTWYGCVPSKALLRCAKAAHEVRSAARFGVHGPAPEVRFEEVMAYVWGTVNGIAARETPEALAEHGVDVVFGGARFISPLRLALGDPADERAIEAERTILCTGSHAAPPPVEGLAEVGYLDHVSVFHLAALPKRLIVVGGGPIGCELGQAFARLGSEVTLLQRAPQLLHREDAELAHRLQRQLSREMDLRCSCEVVRVARDGDAKRVFYEVGGEERSVVGDELLVAVGRRATTAGLRLDRAGVRVGPGGLIDVDAYLRTSTSTIYAAGDCASPLQFTHHAEAMARAAARNALFRPAARFDAGALPWATFTDPELAHVGLTEAEARAQDRDVRVYRVPYRDVDRARCDGADEGLGKIVCEPNGTILGASLLGPHAGDALQTVVTAMNAGVSLQKLAGDIFTYPTLARVVRRLGDERFFAEGVSPLVKALFRRW